MPANNDLAQALQKAKNQGLVSINGIERDTGIARSTVRRVLRGDARTHRGTEAVLWQYLQDKGVTAGDVAREQMRRGSA